MNIFLDENELGAAAASAADHDFTVIDTTEAPTSLPCVVISVAATC